MSRALRPQVGNIDWLNWTLRFPSRPRSDTYDLRWTRNRLIALLTSAPDPAWLTAGEKSALRQWIDDFRFEFELDQDDPVPIVDPLAVFGVLTLLTGLAAAPIVPLVTVGAFVTSCGLLCGGISANLDRRGRKRLVQDIQRCLHRIDGILR